VRRGLTAEIDLEAAAHNFREVSRTAANRPVVAVVKADAYGHGAVELSKVYERLGVHALAVAFVSEARELREADITRPIMVLFDRSEIPAYFDLNLTPVLHDLGTAEAFSREASRRNITLGVHVKYDTGMGRMGTLDLNELRSITALPSLKIDGLMSHFSEADIADKDYLELQMQRFEEARSTLEADGIKPMCHIANSAAVLAHPQAHLDAVRPGLVLYGSSPFEDDRPGLPPLRPVMKVTSSVLTIKKFPSGHPVSYGRTFIPRRDTTIALLAAGYADGFIRQFSNNADVLIRSKRAPVVGRVCMDTVAVDVTDIQDVREGDEVIVMGETDGERIDAWELARHASTIPYEILCTFGRFANRHHTGALPQ
jgi:alanine racemase